MKTRILILFFWGMAAAGAWAQSPIQASVFLKTPYTPIWSEYTNEHENLVVTLLFNDLRASAVDVKLRLKIEGLNSTIITKETFLRSGQVQPITLLPGVPTRLTGLNATLQQYFNLNHIDLYGIDKNQFYRTKRLPDGVWRFSLEVLDFRTGKRLNNPMLSTAVAWLAPKKPPMWVQPMQEQEVRAIQPQNLLFQWSPRHGNSFSTEYDFYLYEVIQPITGKISRSKALTLPRVLWYKSPLPLNNTLLLYDISMPALTIGKTYIALLQVRDRDHRTSFENRGFSEALVFKYGTPCLEIHNLKAERVPRSLNSLQLSWDYAPNHSGFKIRFKPAVGNYTWRTQEVNQNSYHLTHLLPNTEYIIDVQSLCSGLDGKISNPIRAKTPAPNPKDFDCDAPPVEYDISNTEPKQDLRPGEVFFKGGNEIEVIQVVAKGNGVFSGIGAFKMGFGGRTIKVLVGFTDNFINADGHAKSGTGASLRRRAMDLAPREKVDSWQIVGDDVVVKIKGVEKRWPKNGQATLLVDPKGKRVFIDRFGNHEIPLEDIDYSKYTPEELLKEGEKLLAQADEALEKKRYGDAYRLGKQGRKLLKEAGARAKQVVGFAKVLLAVVKELGDEQKHEKEDKYTTFDAARITLNKEVTKVNPKNANEASEPIGGILAMETTTIHRKDWLKENKEFKPYYRAYQKYSEAQQKYQKQALIFLLLIDLSETSNINQLAKKLEDQTHKIFQVYEKLNQKGKNEAQIKKAIKRKVKGLIQEEIIQPTLKNFELDN